MNVVKSTVINEFSTCFDNCLLAVSNRQEDVRT